MNKFLSEEDAITNTASAGNIAGIRNGEDPPIRAGQRPGGMIRRKPTLTFREFQVKNATRSRQRNTKFKT